MSNRTPLIAGNWKMNMLSGDTATFLQELSDWLGSVNITSEILIFPSYTSLGYVAGAGADLHDPRILLGAQHCSEHASGAFTGEVSAAMIRDLGARFVLVGHSERRQYHGETEAEMIRRIEQAISNGLDVVYCVGETLEERKAGREIEIVRHQLEPIYTSLAAETHSKITIAYEPVWAIGTGETATPEQAQHMHAVIREMLNKFSSSEVAARTRILYGGSMKPDNADELLSKPDVDGGLIGGASLKADSFIEILTSAEKHV